ncbi:hypothetical protein HAPAU_35880 [Halalkalicoccus paucihalophilus]|uniref:Uncharacterized protein n=1 Tax=Halalkalicoccus paucihalophilus TaxID=1008153 RepID=A0A151AAE0_9EURY|nr:hypothetical protein HAPAU_35880 [Halalkalicoccus paucihalophilus]
MRSGMVWMGCLSARLIDLCPCRGRVSLDTSVTFSSGPYTPSEPDSYMTMV